VIFMDKIKSSLANLNSAIQLLEGASMDLEKSIQKKLKSHKESQPVTNDLFSFPSSVSNSPDTKALASRLDGAIAKVEKLLNAPAGEVGA